jgi:outer membrane protein
MNPFLNRYCWPVHRPGMILVFLLMVIHASGQTFLSLADAIDLGMSNNYGIRVARNDSVIAGHNVTFGNAGILPSVLAYGNWDKASLDAKVRTVTGGAIDRKPAPANLVSAGVQAQWTLFDGTGMFVEYDKLRSLAQMTNLDLKIEIENAVHAITSAYFNITRQKQLLEACKKNLEISDLRLSVSRGKFRSGSGSEQEMLQAEVIRLADTTALTKQWVYLKKAEISLNQLLAVDLQHDFIPEDTITLIVLPPLEQLIEKALRANETFLQAAKMQHLSDLEVKLLRSKQLPRLVLRGGYGYSENKTDAAFINYNRTIGPQIGVTATLGIFDGMNLNRKISDAKLAMENQGIRLKEMEQELISQILDAWYEHENLLQVVILGREGIRMAQKNMAIASDAFTAGMVSSLQLREAQDDLFQSRSNLLDALYQARVKESELLKLCGELVKQGKAGSE